MNILLLGSGAREHALAYKISKSRLTKKIFCAPGNAGIGQLAQCAALDLADFKQLIDFAKKEKIDFTIVGPEAPLAAGIVDEFLKHGLKIFGPVKAAARLESSKVFAKEIMAKYNVPTADFEIFDNLNSARAYVKKIGAPCVIKADGLAQGKGVVVAKTIEEANQALDLMINKRVFGEAGNKVIIEECLEGEEASILVLTDGENLLPLVSSQDHKRIFDGDLGPNTGGMGAYSPAPVVSEKLFAEILRDIIRPTLEALRKEGVIYKGVLYAGIMITNKGPKTLEFNVRFGDPETEAILPRLDSDLLEVMLTLAEGDISKLKLKWKKEACVCVVCASQGYPGKYDKGKEIFGLDDVAKLKDIVVFHAGTRKEGKKILTNGGRVLGVTGLGSTIKEAIEKTYGAVEKIRFDGMQYRRDIGRRAI